MTPAELPGMWQAIKYRAVQGITDAANAMATAYQRRLVTSTLIRYTHPPQTKTPSPPGQPPALVTGTLRRSVRPVYAAGAPGGVATSFVAPHTVYARIQEYGGHIYPVRAKFLRWVEDGVMHFAKHVYLPPRPYMRPTTAEMVADGALHRAALAAFATRVWG